MLYYPKVLITKVNINLCSLNSWINRNEIISPFIKLLIKRDCAIIFMTQCFLSTLSYFSLGISAKTTGCLTLGRQHRKTE